MTVTSKSERISKENHDRTVERLDALGLVGPDRHVGAGEHTVMVSMLTEDMDRLLSLAEAGALAKAQGHVAEFRADGWGLEHPLACRERSLLDCPFQVALNRGCRERDIPNLALGRYQVTFDPDGDLAFEEVS